ncbi:MAG: toll/interleukin-1 receptor domain-containing protein [Pseudobutyrivibrio sp.]|uniref:toll/interleukin-1 receptor domain-containing protein n=1 Tax=Pseudobutyrivibrio sp. TaxID=2014367 RepID=UPI0025F88E82|nr:toll/interleukin-1 receptor domain-containing protein [Pseudobutyrivibrio sp.]MBE5904758.1 toll/interleukin-1 receptor domain-containing protein [Pseudobutyrivibrio sp.]
MKYDAFISYRHLEKDMYVAKRVHRALETAKIPKKIQKEIGRKRINRVFRDQEELPIGSDLGSNIEAALREAKFLIVICSPQTKDSYWVMKEIDTFISMHGRENILAVLVDGEPGDSFPPQILTDEAGNPVEPLAADVRGEKKKIIKKKLKTESLRLAAAILQVDYDDLKQRHRERQMHKFLAAAISIAAVITALAVAFGLYNAYNLDKINAEYQQKLINESKVLAEKSEDALDVGDRRVAALLAMEGLPSDENDRPLVPESVYALSRALDCYDVGAELRHDRILSHNMQVDDFEENLNGTRVVSYDTSKYVYLWNLDTGEKLFELPPEYNYMDSGLVDEITIKDVSFSDNAVVVVSSNSVTGYDEKGEILYQYNPEGSIKNGIINQVANKVVFIDHFSGLVDTEYITKDTLVVMDTTTGEVIKKYDDHLDFGFGYHFAIDNNGNYVAVDRHVDVDQKNILTVYNLETDEYVDCTLAEDCNLEAKFTVDGQIAVASIDYDDLLSVGNVPMHFQKFDIAMGQELWNVEAQDSISAFDTSYTHISSTITDIDGEECGRIIFNTSKAVSVLDLYTGELVNTIPSDASIQRIGFNGSGDYIYVGTNDGKLTLYTTKPGITLSNGVNEVMDNTMIDWHIANGTLVASAYRGANLTVMKYSNDESLLYETECENEASRIPAISPDGSSYVVSGSIHDTEEFSYEFNVIDTATGDIKGTFTVPHANSADARYVDSDKIVVPSSNGNIYVFTISNGKLEPKKLLEGTYSGVTSYSADGKYMLYSGGAEKVVLSIPDLKIKYQVNNHDANISTYSCGTIANNGKTIYYISSTDNDSLCKYNIEKDKIGKVIDDYQVDRFALSDDNTLLAAACKDGKLRIYDIKTMDCLDEITFYAKSYSGLIKFSQDNTHLYLQGADLYFKIYDLTNKDFVFKFKEQTNELDYCQYDETTNRLIVSNFIGMSIIDLNQMGELSYIEHGLAYVPQSGTVVCTYRQYVYGFKFEEVDELLKMANDIYGDDELTDLEKLDYGIE